LQSQSEIVNVQNKFKKDKNSFELFKICGNIFFIEKSINEKHEFFTSFYFAQYNKGEPFFRIFNIDSLTNVYENMYLNYVEELKCNHFRIKKNYWQRKKTFLYYIKFISTKKNMEINDIELFKYQIDQYIKNYYIFTNSN
jgi:hypothetical protein